MIKNVLNIQKKAVGILAIALMMAVTPASTALASGAWGYVGSPGFSEPAIVSNASYNPSITLDGSTPYISYAGNVGGNAASTVMKFNGTSWETVGPVGFVQGVVHLALDGSTPYVAYRDVSEGNKVSVKRFNGAAWEYVGSAGLSAGSAEHMSLALDGSTPYVAYIDGSESNKVTVKRFSNSSWETVGTPGFSTAALDFDSVSLVLDGSTPYVAYSDENDLALTVMKFNGTSWETVGAPGALGYAYRFDLALGVSTPYVAFADMYSGDGDILTVMKFNGTSWETVGAPGIGQSLVEYADFTLAVYGSTPIVAYPDAALGVNHDVTVKRFNGTSWEAMGATLPGGFSLIGRSSLAMNGSTPYIVYAGGGTPSNRVSVVKFINDPTLLANAEDGKAITLTLPEGATLTCGNTIKEDVVNPDSEHEYPLGFVDFCFTANGNDNQVRLVFETNLQPNQVVARKYNSTTHQYSNVPGATITSTTYNGQPALQLAYTIADNGELDQDSTVGSIQDPVGLALVQAVGTPNVPGAPNAGVGMASSPAGISTLPIAISSFVGIAMLTARTIYRSQR